MQAPLQKIELQRLLTDLPFQLGNPALRPTLFAVAGKVVTGSLAELPPPSLQNVGTDLQRTCRFRDRYPCSSRRTAASLNSLVNCLGDNPGTQFSI